MKNTLLALAVAACAFGASSAVVSNAYASSCAWGQRSTCVDSDRAHNTGNQTKSNYGSHTINDLGGVRRG